MKKTSRARPPILPCQAMFGLERGQQIVDQIETTSGQLCPCKQGKSCVLVGDAAGEEPPPIRLAV